MSIGNDASLAGLPPIPRRELPQGTQKQLGSGTLRMIASLPLACLAAYSSSGASALAAQVHGRRLRRLRCRQAASRSRFRRKTGRSGRRRGHRRRQAVAKGRSMPPLLARRPRSRASPGGDSESSYPSPRAVHQCTRNRRGDPAFFCREVMATAVGCLRSVRLRGIRVSGCQRSERQSALRYFKGKSAGCRTGRPSKTGAEPCGIPRDDCRDGCSSAGIAAATQRLLRGRGWAFRVAAGLAGFRRGFGFPGFLPAAAWGSPARVAQLKIARVRYGFGFRADPADRLRRGPRPQASSLFGGPPASLRRREAGEDGQKLTRNRAATA